MLPEPNITHPLGSPWHHLGVELHRFRQQLCFKTLHDWHSWGTCGHRNILWQCANPNVGTVLIKNRPPAANYAILDRKAFICSEIFCSIFCANEPLGIGVDLTGILGDAWQVPKVGLC